MRIVCLLLIVTLPAQLRAQVVCGTANENSPVTLTAPAGHVFTAIEFASYGTPNGSCGSFTFGACHSASSATVCSNTFVGQNSATVTASNGVFTDPCVGTVKRLYVQARYDALVPLTLTSFTARKLSTERIRLEWTSAAELNTSHFIIEKSTDGKSFEEAGKISAAGEGSGSYSYDNNISSLVPLHYYRLKMVDIDGKLKFSHIVRVNIGLAAVRTMVYPNPAEKVLTVMNDKPQEAVITNIHGVFIRKIILVNGTRSIDVSNFLPGVYFIRTSDKAIKFIKR